MGIAVAGIASGIDSDSIINQLLALEEQRIFQIQRRIAIEEEKRVAFDDLSGRLDGLRRAASKFSDDDVFGKLVVESSDPSILTASSTSKSAVGNYSVEVLQKATSHRIAAQGFIDDTSTGVALADGTFEFKVGDGSTKTIDVSPSMSLSAFADAISSSGAGVNASIVNDGSSTNPYRLVLTSTKEGEAGLITVTQNDTSLDFANKQIEAVAASSDNAADYDGAVTSGGNYTGDANTTFIVEIMADGAADGTAKYRVSTDGGLSFDDNGGIGFDVTSNGPLAIADGVTINFEDDGTLRTGDRFSIDTFNPSLREPQDAILNVNGITIRKSSNKVNDVFDGVTFDLVAAQPGKTVNIKVSRDAGTVETNLMAFVGAYNGVVGFLKAQFSYDPADGGLAPPLSGDSAARQAERDVKRLISTRLEGVGSDTVSSLSELGLDSNEKTGIVSFNPMKLSTLMRDDPASVERVLTRFGERLNGNFTYHRRTSATKPGTYDVEITQARTRAQVNGGAAAEALAANEDITIQFNRRVQANNNHADLTVNLQAGDTPDQQVTRINDAIEAQGFDLTAYLDNAGRINLRANEYGDDYYVSMQSNLVGVAGTSRIGNAVTEDTGTDLEGRIGGVIARTLDGDHLKGPNGYDVEGVEVIIPNDVSGDLGQLRVVDGLAETVPSIIEALTGNQGVLRSRTDGLSNRISDLESEIIKQQDRIQTQESRLRKQFTRMEVTLGKLDALEQYISQQLQAMNNSNKKK